MSALPPPVCIGQRTVTPRWSQLGRTHAYDGMSPRIAEFMSSLRGESTTVLAPDGRSYEVRVVPFAFGNFSDAIPSFLIRLLRAKRWTVEVIPGRKPPKAKGWRPIAHAAIVADTPRKVAAQDEARRTVEMIAKHGWDEGVTFKWC